MLTPQQISTQLAKKFRLGNALILEAVQGSPHVHIDLLKEGGQRITYKSNRLSFLGQEVTDALMTGIQLTIVMVCAFYENADLYAREGNRLGAQSCMLALLMEYRGLRQDIRERSAFFHIATIEKGVVNLDLRDGVAFMHSLPG